MIKCSNGKQITKLLSCDNLGCNGQSIPVAVRRFTPRPYKSRAVISGVPLDLSEADVIELAKTSTVSFAKRLKRKTEQGYINSLSVLIGFKSDIVPEAVKIGYLLFRTKPFTPSPKRCFKCNRYGHIAKNCRGNQTCLKCGSKDHKREDCNKDKRCVNCGGEHSAAYAGCSVYKEEVKIQAVRAHSNLSYMEAKKQVIMTSNPHQEVRVATPRISQQIAQASVHPTQSRPTYSAMVASPQRATVTATPVQTSHRPYFSCSADKPTTDDFRCVNELIERIKTDPLEFYTFIAKAIQISLTAALNGNEVNIFDIIRSSMKNCNGHEDATGNGNDTQTAS